MEREGNWAHKQQKKKTMNEHNGKIPAKNVPAPPPFPFIDWPHLPFFTIQFYFYNVKIFSKECENSGSNVQ
jgi:hypothetical protein